MGRGDIEAVTELLAVAAEVDGHAPLGEHRWLDLVHGGRQSFAGLVAWEAGHDHPVGFAQLSRGAIAPGHPETPAPDPQPNPSEQASGSPSGVAEGHTGPMWELEYVVDPHHRGTEPSIDETLLRAALDAIADEGGGHLHLWVPKPTDEHYQLASAVGLRPGRELNQLRRPLPAGDSSTLEVRAFEPGRDEGAWLEVNNRAFRWHPEQGGWDMGTLQARQQEPWFDPSGFLLHERDGKLAGFCWTKVHRDTEPPIGEIYVVAVDPSVQQSGLGRALVLTGLDWLSRQGLAMAMLYVDAHNEPATRLYESLGFTLDHVDQAFVGDVAPSEAGSPARS